jgi:hypothetical protein
MIKSLFSFVFATIVAAVAMAEQCPYRHNYALNTVCDASSAGQICEYLHPGHGVDEVCECSGDCLCFECVCDDNGNCGYKAHSTPVA